MAEEVNSGYCTVDSIVKSALADYGEGTTHKYDQFLHWALEALKDFHMDSAKEIKTTVLEMNSYNAIDFPSDFIDWCKVGIQVGDKIKTFGVNDKIAMHFDTTDCDTPARNSEGDCNSLPSNCDSCGGYWFNNFVNEDGEILGRMFGIGGGENCLGYFRINKERRQILFDSSVTQTNIYLEYISTGFNPCEETVVNQYASKLIKFYIHWMRSIFKDGPNSGNANKWEEMYYNEYRLVRARLSDLTPEGVIEFSRKNYKLSIKN